MDTKGIDSVKNLGIEGQTALTLTLSRKERGQTALTQTLFGMGTGLLPAWLAIVLLLVASAMASTAAAQDDDRPQPRSRSRTAARQYPDEESPVRTVAASDDAAELSPPLPINVESPSNQPGKRAKAKAAGETTETTTVDANGEPIPAPRGVRAHNAPRRVESEDEARPAAEQGGLFHEEGQEEGDFGVVVPSIRGLAQGHLWFRGEALLWWLKGGNTPPLLTTSPPSTPPSQAGVLPNATVLFGDQEMNQGLHAGTRITFGTWLGACEESGVEFSYMIIGENTQSFNASSMGNPILARPFFNTATGAEDSHIIAYPNSANGSFSSSSTENFQGAEVVWRRAIVHPACDGRIDILMGYRFNRLTDGLEIFDSTTGTISPGTTIGTHDSFHTRNDFNGGELGFSSQLRNGRWSLDTLLKMGIGSTHTEVAIDGATAINTTILQGGLLALPSNIGTHSSNQFSVMPEIGFTLAYDISPHLKASVGYTLLYWSNVARPGDQIDLNVDANQFPGAGQTAGEKPAFALHTSDFWAQGVNLGLDYRF